MNHHPNQVPKTSTMAIISLVTALLCIPLVSIILGHLARGEVRKSNGTIAGAGIALAGLIIGYLQIVSLLLFFAVGLIGGLGLAASNMEKTFGSGKEDAAKTWVNSTGDTYVELYFIKTSSYPESLNDLMELPGDGQSPFISEPSTLVDPWGKQYQYRYPGKENPDSFDLWTVTPDGRTIGNWY